MLGEAAGVAVRRRRQRLFSFVDRIPRPCPSSTRPRARVIIRPVRKIVTAAEMREIDRLTTERYATPSLLLMEAAARAAAQEITALFPGGIEDKGVLVLSGRGNNGGDGAALARQLCLAGACVDFVLFGRVDESVGDARVNFEIVRALAEGGAFRGTAHPDLSDFSAFAGSNGAVLFWECNTLEEWERVMYQVQTPHDVIVDALP